MCGCWFACLYEWMSKYMFVCYFHINKHSCRCMHTHAYVHAHVCRLPLNFMSSSRNDDPLLADIRHTKQRLLHAKLRRCFVQVQKAYHGNVCLRRSHERALSVLLTSARADPRTAAEALKINLHETDPPALRPAKQALLDRRPCLCKTDGEKPCNGMALPFTNQCGRRILSLNLLSMFLLRYVRWSNRKLREVVSRFLVKYWHFRTVLVCTGKLRFLLNHSVVLSHFLCKENLCCTAVSTGFLTQDMDGQCVPVC